MKISHGMLGNAIQQITYVERETERIRVEVHAANYEFSYM